MKSVLHLINGEFYSGAERVQDLLASRLPDYGYKVEFVCLKGGVFTARRTYQDADVTILPMKSRFSLDSLRALNALIRSKDIRLIHTHTPRTSLIGALSANRGDVPMVHHLHSPTLRCTESLVRNYVNSAVEWMAMRRANKVITVSNSLRSYLRGQGIGSSKVVTVHNGIRGAIELIDRSAPRADHWVLGTVALFRPRKGLEILLEAMAKLRFRGVPVSLLAVGDFESPAYRNEVLGLVDRLRLDDAVNWTGFVSDVVRELRKMDLFVLPSLLGEGLPMVLLESMSAGTPVVVTAVEGVTEVVDSGRDGLVVVPSSSDEIASAILSYVEGKVDWNLIRRNAFDRQREYFSDQVMAAGVARVYDEILA